MNFGLNIAQSKGIAVVARKGTSMERRTPHLHQCNFMYVMEGEFCSKGDTDLVDSYVGLSMLHQT